MKSKLTTIDMEKRKINIKALLKTIGIVFGIIILVISFLRVIVWVGLLFGPWSLIVILIIIVASVSGIAIYNYFKYDE
jgi:hypothetical protein